MRLLRSLLLWLLPLAGEFAQATPFYTAEIAPYQRIGKSINL